MKRNLLLLIFISASNLSIAQIEMLPNGFRRAVIAPDKTDKKQSFNSPPDSKNGEKDFSLLKNPFIPLTTVMDTEVVVGVTYYDLQTNGAISNHIVFNPDSTISAVWNFSPDNINSTSPPYPNRGTGYVYYNGNSWGPTGGPTTRIEPTRTGFPNIVVTPSGAELAIANAAHPGGLSKISVTTRPVKGTGVWTQSFPWAPAYDTWTKAVSAGNSETVYCIFHGSGAGDTIPLVAGQQGPIYFTKSTDAGLTWSSKMLIHEIDSNFYLGFSGDVYSIDAIGDTVAIVYSGAYVDVGLLISHDGGTSWTKKIIQKHPIPFYDDTLTWGVAPDSIIRSNSGDANVLIDHNGMCHVWFSGFDYRDDSAQDGYYSPFDDTDGLYYWNENMPEDTGGLRHYVLIATTQDFNGNGIIDFPTVQITGCILRRQWGNYGPGLTQKPSAGIDDNGRIFLTYQALAEYPSTDTTEYATLRRHVYMTSLHPPYDPADWTYPYDIVPSNAMGGNGLFEESVFASVAKRASSSHAYVIYQRDPAPGHSQAADGSCDKFYNTNLNEIIVAGIETLTLDRASDNSNDLFISQNYPNPSDQKTYINLGLKKSSAVLLEVRDMPGKLIYMEKIGTLKAGSHTIPLVTSAFSPGVYNYTVTAAGMKASRLMIVQ